MSSLHHFSTTNNGYSHRLTLKINLIIYHYELQHLEKKMKISRIHIPIVSFFKDIYFIEILIGLAMISLLSLVILLPVGMQKMDRQNPTIKNFVVGDRVFIKGIEEWGTVNCIDGNDYVDVLVLSGNGQPTILKDIDTRLFKQ